MIRNLPFPRCPRASSKKRAIIATLPIPAVGAKPIRHNIGWLRSGNEQLITRQDIPRFACARIKVMMIGRCAAIRNANPALLNPDCVRRATF